MKVAVTDDRFRHYQEEEEVLGKCGAELFVCPECEGEEILEYIADADGLLVNQFKMTGNIINQLQKCRIISRYGIGYDNVDIEAAKARGIPVARVPDYCFEEVGEHALGMMLAVSRNLTVIDRKVRAGEWNIHPDTDMPRLAGSTLGIIGYGSTGRALHRKTAGIGFGRVLLCDPVLDKAEGKKLHAEITSFDKLISESDYISVHVPYNEQNDHLIDSAALAKMKKTAVLINTSRGRVVDNPALFSSLKEKRIRGAGIDVFDSEPPKFREKFSGLENLIVSDHCAYYSNSSVSDLKIKAALNIADVFMGKPPRFPVT